MKKFRTIQLTLLSLIFLLPLLGCQGNASNPFLILIGAEKNYVLSVTNTDILVIDAEYYSSTDIQALKANGNKEIYTYINIGSIEEFRPYFETYSAYSLGTYENWEEEQWIDVSRYEWQEFVSQRVDSFVKKGVDGFFVDNTDVYYFYPQDEIFDGIQVIISQMKDTGKKVIINGGDTFVQKYLETGQTKIFDGVNQECVYTKYDFENDCFTLNDNDTRLYYSQYLDLVLENGYTVYVTEYAIDPQIRREAIAYSNSKNYICYVADNIELR